MAQQIVADVNEIFEDAFGAPAEGAVRLRFGARIGLVQIQKANKSPINPTPGETLAKIFSMVQAIHNQSIICTYWDWKENQWKDITSLFAR
jgi:hypothetical protein